LLSVILAVVLFIFDATLTQQFSTYLDKLPWTSAHAETTETASDDENSGIFGAFSEILNGLSGIVSSSGSDGMSGDLLADDSETDGSEADMQTASTDGLAWIDGDFKVTYELDEGAGLSAFMNRKTTPAPSSSDRTNRLQSGVRHSESVVFSPLGIAVGYSV
jgi:hypothetical protein